jgi:uncharacterized protein
MKFWDSSAIVPLLVNESASVAVRKILKADSEMVVWWASRTECLSALYRRIREGSIEAAGEKQVRNILSALSDAWAEVLPSDFVRQRAERLLSVHRLRAADAFQLAAALVWSKESTTGLEFVCLDDNLCEAASKEGFLVAPRV